MLRHQFDDGLGGGRGAGQCGGNVQHQHPIVFTVREQRLQGGGIAGGIRIADDVDGVCPRPGPGQDCVQPRQRLGRYCRGGAAEIDQSVDREHADTAPVREDGEALARERLLTAEGLCGSEELVEVEHAQEAGAPECRLVNRIRSRKRPGMGGGGAGAVRVPPRLDDHDGFGARRRAGGGHELSSVVDAFDVKQDRAGAAVGSKEVEAVGEIHIDLVAERHDRGESHLPLRRPFDEPCGNGAGLGQKREVARLRGAGREAGVQLGERGHDAEAVGAHEPKSMAAGRKSRLLAERTWPVAHARGHDNRCRGAFRARGLQNTRHAVGRHRDDHHVGSLREILDARETGVAFDLRIRRIDDVDRSRKAAVSQVLEQATAERFLARACPHNGYGGGREELVEPVCGHASLRFSLPARRGSRYLYPPGLAAPSRTVPFRSDDRRATTTSGRIVAPPSFAPGKIDPMSVRRSRFRKLSLRGGQSGSMSGISGGSNKSTLLS
jgi:hypothetical protein